VLPHVPTVRTTSRATAAQIVIRRARSRAIEHIGSAHDDVELELPAGRASGRGTPSYDFVVRPYGAVGADLDI